MKASQSPWVLSLSARLALFASAAALLAVLGCGQRGSRDVPDALRAVAPAMVESHGNLHFVLSPAIGFQVAARQGLPCLLFFTAEWCTYCHQMESAAFNDEAVSALADGFVCILIDADREPELCRNQGVSGFPTIQFLSPDGRILHRLVGRQTAAQLAMGMRAASKRYAWLTGSATTVR